MRKPEVLALQRHVASLQSGVGRIMGDIGASRERIARSREQTDGVKKAAVEPLQKVGAELNDARERMRSAFRES